MIPTQVPPTITASTTKREAFPSLCQWFLKCTNVAEYAIPHPILGDVAACKPCTEWYDRMNAR